MCIRPRLAGTQGETATKQPMVRALLHEALTQRKVKLRRLTGNRAGLRIGRGFIFALRTDVIKKSSA